MRQKATKHSAMRDLYTKRYPTKKSSLIRICERIVEKYTGMAEEYEALVQLHKDLAAAQP